MGTFVIECVIICVVFTILVVTAAKKGDPIDLVYDYPQPIIDRAYELGLISQDRKTLRRSVLIKKCIAMAILGIPLGFLARYVNHADTFLKGFLVIYGIGVVVSVYDFLIDCVWFCHDKSLIIPGTEDLTDSYHDYMFHARASLRGLLLTLPAAIVAGIVVAVIA